MTIRENIFILVIILIVDSLSLTLSRNIPAGMLSESSVEGHCEWIQRISSTLV